MRRTAAFLAASVVVAAAAPAHAQDEIGLSRDGVTWSNNLTEPLFDPDVRWVPGDERIARFFVRNERPDDGDLTLAIDRVASDALLETGWLSISARAGHQPFRTINGGGREELVDQDDVVAGDPLLVELRIRMDENAPNGTMVLATALDFTVTLTDSDAVLDVGDDGSGPPGGGGSAADPGTNPEGVAGTGFLPGTGTAIPWWLAPSALLLVGGGTFLIVRRRAEVDDTLDTILIQHAPAP